MSPQSSEGSESRGAQKQSLNPAAFNAATRRPSKGSTLHHPSLLPNASTPGPPAATPVLPSTFSVVLGSPPVKSLASNTFESPSTTTKKRGRPFKNPPSLQSTAKKRGRPFNTPEVAAAAAAEPSDHMPKKRGRPFKYPLVPEQILHIVPPEPKFVPFICEWKNCPAELHNLDTLRAHLYTVHLKKQPSSGPQVCLWKKCCQEHEVANAETGRSKFIEKGAEFETKEEWQNHVKAAHLDHIAWHQGDGPKATLGKSTYLRGKQLNRFLTTTRLRREHSTGHFSLLPLRRRRSTSHTSA